MLSNCQQALVKDPTQELFFHLVPVLYAQLEQLPKDFFTAELSQNNFISSCMHNFIYNCRHVMEVDRRIRDRVQKLQQLLVRDFGFKPPQSEESRLQQFMVKSKLGTDYEEDD